MGKNVLLFEIGTEELPPKDLQKLSISLLQNIEEVLTTQQFPYKQAKGFATPRRLAVQIIGIEKKQPPQTVQKKGPPVAIAFDADGKPTTAAIKFAASCKVGVKQLQQQNTSKGAWLFYEETFPGKTLEEVLPELLPQTLDKLPISKNMRWGDNKIQFARPVHWVSLLLNTEVISVELFGKQAGNCTYGHRFHYPLAIELEHAKDYEEVLEKTGMVIADFQQRRSLIAKQAEKLAKKTKGNLLPNEELLDLITGLVENPNVLLGSFKEEYLKLPKEVLIASIQEHQKCLPIITKDQNLLPNFIIISNIASIEPSTIIYGNELVMNARLADAVFLFEEDQKQSLADFVPKLSTITFQDKLGTISQKCDRIAALAVVIAKQIGANTEHTISAAKLCKADLATKMVYEFPELQGIMGYYYGISSSIAVEVATAIGEQYLPKTATDILPSSLAGISIALADRIDSLAGLFAIDKVPTGDKDPFALKRQALAVLRIIIEKELNLDLSIICKEACDNYKNLKSPHKCLQTLQDFFIERLKYWYLSLQDSNPKIFAAVQEKHVTAPLDFYRRLLAVQNFLCLPEAEVLSAANKRVKNILEKTTETLTINPVLFQEKEEQVLYNALQELHDVITPLLQEHKYTEVLTNLAKLRKPIDLFFDKVMVMVDDEKIKTNRIALLQQLRNIFLTVADASLLF